MGLFGWGRKPRPSKATKRRLARLKQVNRHYLVVQRLMLRMNEARDREDVPRMKLLLSRIRRVRDIQIKDLGY